MNNRRKRIIKLAMIKFGQKNNMMNIWKLYAKMQNDPSLMPHLGL